MSAQAFNYTHRSLRALHALFRDHDLIQSAAIMTAWGEQPKDWQAGAPRIIWTASQDSYRRGGEGHAKDTALPRTKGAPSDLVTAKAIWTRGAGADLTLYATESLTFEEMIDLALNALDDLLISRGNYDVISGRAEPKDSHSDSGDLYVLSIAVNLPILKLQRRSQNTATELTTSAEVA